MTVNCKNGTVSDMSKLLDIFLIVYVRHSHSKQTDCTDVPADTKNPKMLDRIFDIIKSVKMTKKKVGRVIFESLPCCKRFTNFVQFYDVKIAQYQNLTALQS